MHRTSTRFSTGQVFLVCNGVIYWVKKKSVYCNVRRGKVVKRFFLANFWEGKFQVFKLSVLCATEHGGDANGNFYEVQRHCETGKRSAGG